MLKIYTNKEDKIDMDNTIKLIATDLDGTFFRDDKTYSDEFFTLYEKMKQKGILFVVASGNQYELIQSRFEPIKDEILYICENGTKIVYQNQILYKNTLQSEDVYQLLQVIEKHTSCNTVLCGTKHAYILNRFKEKESFLRDFYRNYQFVETFDGIDDEILKISIADWSYQIEDTVESIRPHVPDHLILVTTGNVWFGIFNKESNKGTAMQFVQKHFHISKESCMAFGDLMNDYDLLKNVGKSYAMENACDELKKVAKHIAPSNEDDGVIQVLKQFL